LRCCRKPRDHFSDERYAEVQRRSRKQTVSTARSAAPKHATPLRAELLGEQLFTASSLRMCGLRPVRRPARSTSSRQASCALPLPASFTVASFAGVVRVASRTRARGCHPTPAPTLTTLLGPNLTTFSALPLAFDSGALLLTLGALFLMLGATAPMQVCRATQRRTPPCGRESDAPLSGRVLACLCLSTQPHHARVVCPCFAHGVLVRA